MWRYCQQIVKIWKIKNKIGDIASNGPTTRIQNEQQQVIKQVNKSQTKKNNQTLNWINNKSWDKWSDMKAVELIFTFLPVMIRLLLFSFYYLVVQRLLSFIFGCIAFSYGSVLSRLIISLWDSLANIQC